MLDNKNAIVTGGTRGIGRAIVKVLASKGANVCFTYVSSSHKADELVEELTSAYQDQKFASKKSNASSMEDTKELIDFFGEEFGALDILVNNAGVTRDNLLLRMSEEQWQEVMDVNLKSVFNLCKCALRPMMKNRSGSIINIGSVVGSFGNAGQINYAASKAGLIGFSKSLAKEVGSRSIRSNVVAPGFIATEMTDELDEKTIDNYKASIPLGRFGEAEEVAHLVSFLAGDESKYITGQVLSVCGGMNM